MDTYIPRRKGSSLVKEIVHALFAGGTIANICYLLPLTHSHAHTYMYTHLHQEKIPRVRIHVRRKAPPIYTFACKKKGKKRKRETRGCFPPPRRDSFRSRRGSRGSPRGRFRAFSSNVVAPTTGKVSKLYSGLRISRISIPYYTTYYLTQTSSRGLLLLRPPLRPPFFSSLALNSPDRLFRQVASSRLAPPPRSIHRANLSRALDSMRPNFAAHIHLDNVYVQLNNVDTIVAS